MRKTVTCEVKAMPMPATFSHMDDVAIIVPASVGVEPLARYRMTLEPIEPEPLAMLPCPHCGHLPLMFKKRKKERACVRCMNCLATMYGFSEENAIAVWNRRA